MDSLLKIARDEANLTQSRLGSLAGTTQPQIRRLENGERKLTREWALRLAPHLGVTPERLLFAPEDVGTVPLKGYVGAGATFYAFDAGDLGRVAAPEGANDNTVAVEIQGESLGALFDQWLVFYDEVRDPPTRDLVGKLCVVGLSDGRILVKQLRRGQIAGHFNLWSNTEQPIYDAVVEWAAVVRQMTPR